MNEPVPRRSIAPVVLGIVLTCVLLAVIGYAASLRRGEEANVPPALTLLSPVEGAVVDSPIVIRFRAESPMELKSTGWGQGRFHIHAWINTTAYMPAAADIRSTSGAVYEWTLHGVSRGSLQLTLGWADQAHRRWPAGSTAPVTLQIR